MDAEPVGVCAGSAHAVCFRLRSLYAVLPGVAAIFDFAGSRVWMLCVDFLMGALIADVAERFSGRVAGL